MSIEPGVVEIDLRRFPSVTLIAKHGKAQLDTIQGFRVDFELTGNWLMRYLAIGWLDRNAERMRDFVWRNVRYNFLRTAIG